jgi:hypothetical protein
MTGTSPWSELSTAQTAEIYDMITRSCPERVCPSSGPVRISALYPLYIRLGETGSPRQLGSEYSDVELNHNVTFQIDRFQTGDIELPVEVNEWWSVASNRSGAGEGLAFVLVNDKLAGAGLASSLLSLGVVGFYVVGVLAAGRMIRGELSEIVRDALYRDPDMVGASCSS